MTSTWQPTWSNDVAKFANAAADVANLVTKLALSYKFNPQIEQELKRCSPFRLHLLQLFDFIFSSSSTSVFLQWLHQVLMDSTNSNGVSPAAEGCRWWFVEETAGQGRKEPEIIPFASVASSSSQPSSFQGFPASPVFPARPFFDDPVFPMRRKTVAVFSSYFSLSALLYPSLISFVFYNDTHEEEKKPKPLISFFPSSFSAATTTGSHQQRQWLSPLGRNMQHATLPPSQPQTINPSFFTSISCSLS